jgi:hypothetical protein
MIYDYGLEPELLATWGELHNYRFFFDKFGLGTPRAVSRYPRDWKDRVFAAAAGTGEIERTRVDELVQMISENMIKRDASPYNAASAWLENAEREHVDRPFDLILARSNPQGSQDVVTEVLPGCHERWDVKDRPPRVPRNAADMAAAVAPMLKNCTVVYFIDPNFSLANERYRNTMEAFFDALVTNRNGRPLTKIEIHSADKSEKQSESTSDFFRQSCERYLPRIIPFGLKVTVRRWKQRAGQEKLHDRFILTDLGGVGFTVGLDNGRGGETTGIRLISREEYRLLWSQYAGAPPTFDVGQPEPFPAIGTKRQTPRRRVLPPER